MYEAAWRRSCMIALYGYCISILYWAICANCQAGTCQGNDFRWTTLYISPFKPQCLPTIISFKGIICGLGRSCPIVIQRTIQKIRFSRLTHWTGQVTRCSSPAFWYLCKKMHFPFVAAGTGCNICARKLKHHLFDASDLFFSRSRYAHQMSYDI